MKQLAAGRIGVVAARYAENAPLATGCCNACRACVTANVIGRLTAALAGSGPGLRQAARRLLRHA